MRFGNINNFIKKRILYVECVFLMFIISFLSGCGSEKNVSDTVSICIWCDQEEIHLVNERLFAYQKANPNIKYDFKISAENTEGSVSTLLQDPQKGADIFIFPDNQVDRLLESDALLEITYNTDDVIQRNGGADATVVSAISNNGALYGYPKTSGNGYFLYYNKQYLSEEEILSLESILTKGMLKNKSFSMDFSSGWYLYSFFKGAGLNLYEDDGEIVFEWNDLSKEITGFDVSEYLVEIAKNPAFVNNTDKKFIEGVKKRTVFAGVSGAWNSKLIEEVWGDNMGVAHLPSFTINGNEFQMATLTGFKYYGINKYTANPDEVMKIADFLSNEESQRYFFGERGECPTNINVAKSEAVQSSEMLKVLFEQSEAADLARFPDEYWTQSCILGTIIASGNADDVNLQKVLFNMGRRMGED